MLQTALRCIAGPGIRTICDVDCGEQRIGAASLDEALADLRRRHAHGLTRDMAGGTASAVAAETLEKRAVGVRGAVDVECFDRPGRVKKNLDAIGLIRNRRTWMQAARCGNDERRDQQRASVPARN